MTDNFRPVVNATSTSATNDITKPMTDNLKQTIDEQLIDVSLDEAKRMVKIAYQDSVYYKKSSKIFAHFIVFLLAVIFGILYASINLSFGFQWGAL